MIRSLLVISIGASLGAVLRWGLGAAFNALFPAIPPGTWLANMLGGYLMGVALAYFGQHTGLAPEWRLLVITGLSGRLDDFLDVFGGSHHTDPAGTDAVGRSRRFSPCGRLVADDTFRFGDRRRLQIPLMQRSTPCKAIN